MENCKTNFMCGFTACMVNQVPDSLSSRIDRHNFINSCMCKYNLNMLPIPTELKDGRCGRCLNCRSYYNNILKVRQDFAGRTTSPHSTTHVNNLSTWPLAWQRNTQHKSSEWANKLTPCQKCPAGIPLYQSNYRDWYY